ncbi:MAG: gamma-glutamyltransferase family protein, partial [Pseudomonadota bacterium]
MNLRLWVLCFTLFGCSIQTTYATRADTAQQPPREDREPEAATGVSTNKIAIGEEFMVASANPYATWAGKRIIEQGGDAIDAAVAIQAMLTLVEPQSSGIGGGAFILYWDNQKKKLFTYDGRETAPASADANIFEKDGEIMSWRDAVVGGNSVGVPGVLRALEMAHSAHGNLDWSALFDDAIDRSTNGFQVSPRLARLLSIDIHPGMHAFVESSSYFKSEGAFLKEGFIRKNKLLAETLTNIAAEGTDYFYTGEMAQRIVDTVRFASINPGKLRVKDLKEYEAVKRSPMCGFYRSYKVCGMAPPSSGGVTVMQILKGLEPFELSKYGPDSAEFVHLFSQASALAFADREYFVADLDFLGISPVPLVNPRYMSERASLISLNKPLKKAKPGKPYAELSVGQDNALELSNTSHISIVDKQGNAVSMTSSVEFMFGSGLMVGGFMLNNQLTDFSLDPQRNGEPVLNRVQARKRPRSAMSPTMVFDKD